MQPVEELPKLKKTAKPPKEEPKKEEVKRAKVKIPKAKKYEDLPEIPDYERPELEIYEETAFEPGKLTKGVEDTMQKSEVPVISTAEIVEPAKNGFPKVSFVCAQFSLSNRKIIFNTFWLFIAPFVNYLILFLWLKQTTNRIHRIFC